MGLLQETNLGEQGDGSTIVYKGERMKKETAEVLEHVVDHFDFHFGQATAPNVKFAVDKLTRLPYDEKYKSANQQPSDKITGDLLVAYTEVNKSQQTVLAIDNCYIDLSEHSKRDGSAVSNYGATWVNVYLANAHLKDLYSKVQKDTKWVISNTGITLDNTQGLVSFPAGMDTESPPTFYVMRKEVDDNDLPTGEISITHHGTIPTVYEDGAPEE